MPSEITINRLYETMREVPDFPEPGILFYDITPILLNSELLGLAVEQMAESARPLGVDRVMGIESRGFIFGAPLALELGAGFVLARKPGKLPWNKQRVEYSLEYGTDAIEVHTDSFEPGQRVLIVDDLLATGGTARAAGRIVTDAGADLAGFSFMVELSFLNGREKLPNTSVFSLLKYPRSE